MKIHSNGSKWAGEPPDSIEKLLDVLSKNTLDPRMENYGLRAVPYILIKDNGYWDKVTFHLFGNFYELSHVFSISGTIRELLPLLRAVKANKRTEEYKAVRAELIGEIEKVRKQFHEKKTRRRFTDRRRARKERKTQSKKHDTYTQTEKYHYEHAEQD